jgi:hypothetical protein
MRGTVAKRIRKAVKRLIAEAGVGDFRGQYKKAKRDYVKTGSI